MELRAHQPSDQEVSLKAVFRGDNRECLAYGYYDLIDHVVYQGFLDGSEHSVKVIDDYTKQDLIERRLPAVNLLTNTKAIKGELVSQLASLAMDIRRQLPIEGQLRLF